MSFPSKLNKENYSFQANSLEENPSTTPVTPTKLPLPTSELLEEEKQLNVTSKEITQQATLLKSDSNERSVLLLMETYTKAWNDETKTFDVPSDHFIKELFQERLVKHRELFNPQVFNTKKHFGFINKLDLDPASNPKLYLRADLHGDLKSLIENLRTLQQQGFLDEAYQCRSGFHLVFLGDYCDRGKWGSFILDLLMSLREENPKQIHLIRGNHESSKINKLYCRNDLFLKRVVGTEEGFLALNNFYETMPLTTYFSLAKEGERHYIQCTHGLFEPSMDPDPLLDHPEATASIVVPKKRTLSERIKKIDPSSPLGAKVKRLQQIVEDSASTLTSALTAYSWGDVQSENTSNFGPLATRQYKFCAQDVRCYLDLSSEKHKVEMLFRGHQHDYKHLLHQEKILVTTLPVGVDCPAYQEVFKQPDRAYLLEPKEEVKDWTKQVIVRERGHNRTNYVTEPQPLLQPE